MLRDTYAQTVLIWSDHVSVSLMLTPRNLKEQTCSTWIPSTQSSKVLQLLYYKNVFNFILLEITLEIQVN